MVVAFLGPATRKVQVMCRSISSGFVSLALLASSCAEEESPRSVQAASATSTAAGAAADATREGTLFHLEGRHGTPDSQWIEASYKVRREAGQLSKTLQLDIEKAPPGVAHVLTLDGFKLAKLVTSSKGKGEFELTEAGDDFFPDGFVEPKEGSVVRVGDMAEIRLQTVHKLTDLQVDIAGPGKLTGKIGYKVERLGDAVTTEFQVKVALAGAKGVHPVRLDGAHVGDLIVDLAGKGKLLYSTLDGEPFPPGFQAPHAGSLVEVGELYEGELRDNLVDRGQ